MKRIECDRCGADHEIGKSLLSGKTIQHVSLLLYSDPIGSVTNPVASADLCDRCVTTVSRTITENLPREARS